jgi:formylglycine-generating enzyme
MDTIPENIDLNYNPLHYWQLIRLAKKYPDRKFLDTRLENGDTYLTLFSSFGNLRVVKRLLKLGATIEAKNQDGTEAARWAWKESEILILNEFYDKGQKWKVCVDGQYLPMCNIDDKTYIVRKAEDHDGKETIDIVLVSDVSKLPVLSALQCQPALIAFGPDYNPEENPDMFYRADLVYKAVKPIVPESVKLLLEHFSKGKNSEASEEFHLYWKKQTVQEIPNSIGMEFVYIPQGEFMMGCSDTEYQSVLKLMNELYMTPEDKKRWVEEWLEDEKPAHRVKITKPFYMSKYAVTVGEFKKFIDETNYQTEAEKEGWAYAYKKGKWDKVEGICWNNPGFKTPQADNHPVVCVSWNDVQEFIKWLNGLGVRNQGTGVRESDSEIENPKFIYRLPTEAEWEYAARAGTKTMFYWGNGKSGKPMVNCADETTKKLLGLKYCWKGYESGFVYTSPVGSFEPNDFCLYDMLGNVWEWTGDLYDKEYYIKSQLENPINVKIGQNYVIRGGSWLHDPMSLRSSNRYYWNPEFRFHDLGFRLVLVSL